MADVERHDIVRLCERLRSDTYVNTVTADMQRLHAIVAGIIADQAISRAELLGLSDWLAEHPHLKTCWPYDEIGSVIAAVLADGKIDSGEHLLLQRFFAEFVVLADNKTVVNPLVGKDASIVSLCAVGATSHPAPPPPDVAAVDRAIDQMTSKQLNMLTLATKPAPALKRIYVRGLDRRKAAGLE